jgi:hypothetical protein
LGAFSVPSSKLSIWKMPASSDFTERGEFAGDTVPDGTLTVALAIGCWVDALRTTPRTDAVHCLRSCTLTSDWTPALAVNGVDFDQYPVLDTTTFRPMLAFRFPSGTSTME